MTTTKSHNPRAQGKIAEDNARSFLEQQGLQFQDNNYAAAGGEIDLIMLDGNIQVFVEVRFRSPSPFASALESVTRSKQEKIRRCASHWLSRKKIFDKAPVRFDVVAVNNKGCEWIQGAF